MPAVTESQPLSHPATQPRCPSKYRAYYVARVKKIVPAPLRSDADLFIFKAAPTVVTNVVECGRIAVQ